jgi:site-specific DNA-methyltransferase (adenine-specific)
MKSYYEQDGITIYHGDCRGVLPALATGPCFDLVFTSPPYNLGGRPWPHLGNWKPGDGAGSKSKWRNGSDAGAGVQYDGHEDVVPWPVYVSEQRETLRMCWQLVGAKGAIYYNHKPRVIGAKLWTPLELVPEGLTLRQIVVWARAGGMNFNPTAYVPTHEWIMVLAREEFRLKSKGASGVGDVWYVPAEPSPHPAPFPLGLPRRAIETTGSRSLLDPHCGSGTSLVAAKEAGVRAVGIDKSERYCEMAANRLAQGVLFGVPDCAPDCTDGITAPHQPPPPPAIALKTAPPPLTPREQGGHLSKRLKARAAAQALPSDSDDNRLEQKQGTQATGADCISDCTDGPAGGEHAR